jgi:hypothetical protein
MYSNKKMHKNDATDVGKCEDNSLSHTHTSPKPHSNGKSERKLLIGISRSIMVIYCSLNH